MDPMLIFAMIEKGLTVANMLIEAGKSAKPALDVIMGLAEGAQSGIVTDEQLAATEATLDAQMEEFNKPME